MFVQLGATSTNEIDVETNKGDHFVAGIAEVTGIFIKFIKVVYK